MARARDATFGAQLRRLRETRGLTQEELAERAGLSPNAVSQLERGQRLHPYPHTVRALAAALGLSDAEGAALVAVVPRRDGGAPPPGATQALSLPIPPTALIGRDQELAAVGRLLDGARLVTLTGPGGVGKSRLALEVASEARDLFPDGVVFVDLAPLSDSSLVVSAIADALVVRQPGGQPLLRTLQAYLRHKWLLLLLDNFEHVLKAAAEVAMLLGACPDLHVLATGRAPLRLRGEQELPVQPLGLPDLSHLPSLEEVAGAASVQLFVQRAGEVAPDFDLSRDNFGAVAAICRRLEGLPLAIELAAARVKVLPPGALLARLDRALPVLVGGARDLPERQRTMRDTIGWSYTLLEGGEEALFRRLAVFAGGWALEAAEAVGAGEGVAAGDVLGLLASLVDKSLVVAGANPERDEQRYRMLEPIREYALERLQESGEEEEARRRHASFYLGLAEQAAPELRGPGQVAWLGKLDREADNLRAAMRWYLDRGAWEKVARLGWALWLFWFYHGHLSEGRRWVEEALAKATDLPVSARARLLFVLGTMLFNHKGYDSATGPTEESLALFREVGDKRGIAYALGSAGFIALGQGRAERGAALFEEAAHVFLDAGDRWGAAVMLVTSAAVPLQLGEYDRAARLAEEGLALAREIGDRTSASIALYNLASIALAHDDPGRAKRLFGEGLRLSMEMGDAGNIASCLQGLAEVAVAEAQPERAARLWGTAERLLSTTEVAAYPHAAARSRYEAAIATARAQLGETAFDAAGTEGWEMAIERAVEYALADVLP